MAHMSAASGRDRAGAGESGLLSWSSTIQCFLEWTQ